MSRSTIPESGEVLTHYHHILRKTGTAHTQSKTGMTAYLGVVHALRVDTVIILLYVTNTASNIQCKRCNLDRLKSESKEVTNKTPKCAVPVHAPQLNAFW